MIGADYTYGQEVAFRCDHGYRLTGAHYASCQEDGQWSHTSASCQGKASLFIDKKRVSRNKDTSNNDNNDDEGSILIIHNILPEYVL